MSNGHRDRVVTYPEYVRELEEEIAALRIANDQLCAQARDAKAAEAAALSRIDPAPATGQKGEPA